MKNVSAKLLKVIGAVSGKVKKSGFNTHQRYAYVMEQDLLDAVRDELVKQGLLVTMSVEDYSRVGDITTVKTKHCIIDIETGEILEVFSIGEGQDKGDKAAPKSLTSSSKYFWLKTFLLSGNDDPENDSHEVPKSVEAPKTTNSFPSTPKTTKVFSQNTDKKPEPVAAPQKQDFKAPKPVFNAPKKELTEDEVFF